MECKSTKLSVSKRLSVVTVCVCVCVGGGGGGGGGGKHFSKTFFYFLYVE